VLRVILLLLLLSLSVVMASPFSEEQQAWLSQWMRTQTPGQAHQRWWEYASSSTVLMGAS
jgi:hypothetical protein